MIALATQPHLFFRIGEGASESVDILFRLLEDMQSEALGRFGANTGKSLQLLDEASQRTGINGGPPWWRDRKYAILF